VFFKGFLTFLRVLRVFNGFRAEITLCDTLQSCPYDNSSPDRHLDFQKKKKKWAIRWFFGFLMVLTPEFHFAIHYKVVRMPIPDLIGISDFQKKKKKWATGWFFGFLMVLTQTFRLAIHYKVAI
jgi:hypothetical protein